MNQLDILAVFIETANAKAPRLPAYFYGNSDDDEKLFIIMGKSSLLQKGAHGNNKTKQSFSITNTLYFLKNKVGGIFNGFREICLFSGIIPLFSIQPGGQSSR